MHLVPLLVLPLLISGCETVRDSFGLTHHSPDEFSVYEEHPLTIPPDYTLVPPSNQTSLFSKSQDKAKLILLGKCDIQQNSSGVLEQNVVIDIKKDNVTSPDIRQIIDKESQVESISEKLLEKIRGWKKEFQKNVNSYKNTDKG